MNTTKLPTPLVSAYWLSANLEHPDLIVLDASMEKVRQAKQDFTAQPCISGARFMQLKQDFVDKSNELPNTAPSTQQFTKATRKLGINSNSLIVVYDQHGIYSSPRAWWLFRLMGHSQVAVLDGGLPAWQKAGFACEEFPKQPSYPSGDFQADFQSQLIATLTQVEDFVSTQSHCLLDARAADRFYGRVAEPRVQLRSGHIPHSQNLPSRQVLDGVMMKPKAALQQAFQELNKEDKPFICSCGSGITASVLALALAVTEINNAAVYDGSWSEWGLPSAREVVK